MSVRHRNKCQSQLEALMQERILLLDGAMGTMIQQHNLSESDFRGESRITSYNVCYTKLLR